MSLADEIAALQHFSTAELAAEYERLHGRRPRYRSPAWLRKRIGFQLQVAAHGGLSGPARAELERLPADLRLPDAAPRCRTRGDEGGERNDGRPRPGTVLQRECHGQQIRVSVTEAGFEWNGELFASLSAVAFAITGARWNGRLFFGLVERKKREEA